MRCFVFIEGRIIALKITAFKVERRSSFGSQFSFCCISSTIIILLKRCYRATRRAGEYRIQAFYTDLFYYPVACPQRNLILFISFPCNGHQQNIFCLLVSKTPAETIDCVTECLTYDILRVYCIKFHVSSFTPISDHIAVGSVG